MKAFLTRLTSGILLLVIIGVTCAFGSWPLWIAVTLAGFIGLHEFYRVLEIPRGDTLWWIGMIGAGMWSFISFVAVSYTHLRTDSAGTDGNGAAC